MLEVRLTSVFVEWRDGLADGIARKRINARLDRLGYGLLGDAKTLGQGLSELRIDHGPGYRLYFVTRGVEIVVLLCGGDKSTQQRDIALARRMRRELED